MPHGDDAPALKPWQGFLGLAIGAVGAQVAAAVLVIVTIALWVGIFDASLDLAELETSLPVLAAALVGTQAFILLVAIGLPFVVRTRLRDALGLKRAPAVTFVAGAIGMLGLAPLGDLFMSTIAELAPNLTLGSLPQMLETFRTEPFVLLWPLIALTPGVCEELFFRGMLQRSLLRYGPWLAVLLTSIAFALFHIDPHHVVGVFPLGVYLGFLAVRTRSLFVPMLAHVVNNTASLIAVHITALDVGYGTGRDMPLWWTGAGLALTAACVAVILLATRRPSPAPVAA